MGPLIILGESLNLAQLVGFTLKSHRAMQGITVATGIGQLLMGLFGLGEQKDDTVSVVIATGDRIISAIKDLGSQLTEEIKSEFESQHMAKLAVAQDQLKSTIDIFLNSDGPEGLSPETLKTLEKSFANWRTSITEPIIVNPESGVMGALSWAQAHEGDDYSTFPLYLLAAALQLNYCKLGIGLEYHEMCVNWSRDNTGKPNPHPLPNQKDLKQGLYYRKLVEAFARHTKYCGPRVERIRTGNIARSSAVSAIGRFGDCHTAIARAQKYDAVTKKHHLTRVTDEVALLIDHTYTAIKKAKVEWDGNLF